MIGDGEINLASSQGVEQSGLNFGVEFLWMNFLPTMTAYVIVYLWRANRVMEKAKENIDKLSVIALAAEPAINFGPSSS